MNETTRSAIAAAVILLTIGVVGYYMPAIMVMVGAYSVPAAVALAILFMCAIFIVLWLRSKSKRSAQHDKPKQ